MKTHTDTLEASFAAIARQFFVDDPDAISGLKEEYANGIISREAYDLREAAGLTHAALAKLVGVNAADIVRLEDNDYEGNMFALLWRIARACGRDVKLSFPAAKKSPQPRKTVAPKVKNSVVSKPRTQPSARRIAR